MSKSSRSWTGSRREREFLWSGRPFARQVLTGVFIIIAVLGCAEVAPPPGGPVDKTGPFLVRSEPENGSVNVEPGNKISLYFSERIVRPATGRAVFISPRPSREPKLKWKTDRIELILPDSFAANQTYILSLSSNIADLRGNKLDSSLIVAFSTGPSIDSGKVSGHVYSNDQPVGGLMVGLYKTETFADTAVSFDSIYPAYLTQTNQDGLFAFDFLPKREFRLVAFDDKNRNERFEPDRESFALPDRPIVVGGDIPVIDLRLSLTTQDTTTPEIISVIYTADKLLKVRLTREIPLALLRQSPANIMLRNQDDSLQAFPCLSFQESDKERATVLNCFFGTLADGVYELELTYDVARSSLRYQEVQVEAKDDGNPPVIVRFYPNTSPLFVEQVEMQAVFSEPLDTAHIQEETFRLQTSTGKDIPLSLRWRDRFHLLLEPDTLQEGVSYRLTVEESEIVDLAGNTLGDSTKEYSFTTLASDSLGSIAGEVVIKIAGKESDPVVLSFRALPGQSTYDVTVPGRKFTVDLPGGKYLMSGFIDSDLDGERDNGSIYPFRLAETMASYPDTIIVRPRFETTGITFEFR
jgi:hypothetical protein